MITDHSWISFSALSSSTEAQGTSIAELERSIKSSNSSWECGRYASFPQEVVVRLDFRVQFSYIIIASKPHKNIPDVEAYVGDGVYGSFIDAEYHLGGKASNISDQSFQIGISGIGSYLKLRFITKPKIGPNNPFGQISLALLKIWGRKLDYTMNINQIAPVKSHTDEVDKLLLGMGVPLELILWSKEDLDSFRYAPIDEDSRETLLELDQLKSYAYSNEDFGNLKNITIDMKRVFEIGSIILTIKRELAVSVSVEESPSLETTARKAASGSTVAPGRLFETGTQKALNDC